MPKRPLQDIIAKPRAPKQNVPQGIPDALPTKNPFAPPPHYGGYEPKAPTVDNAPKQQQPFTSHTVSDQSFSDMPERAFPSPRRNRTKLYITIAAVVLVVVGFFYLLSGIFASTTLTVHPKHESVPVDGSFVATKADIPGQLRFETVSFDVTAEKQVPATETTQAEDRASGKITIYNNYSDNASQRLIKNTRFETSDGKIFRIHDSIEVPGRVKQPDGSMTPGSVEVTVYADQPGDAYNIGATDFTIPGFKGTARYDAFSAKSSGPMTGGFVGTKHTISDATLATVTQELQDQLKTELPAKALGASTTASTSLSFKNATFVSYESLPIENRDANTVLVQVKGTLHSVVFDRAHFAQYLASETIAGYDGNLIELLNPDDLDVSIDQMDASATDQLPWNDETVHVKVKGMAQFKWILDETQLKKDLAGREKRALPTILSGYPSIAKAEVVIRPFWKTSFPNKPGDIKIVEKLD